MKIGEGRFLTSRRKTDFNHLAEAGLVLIEARGAQEVMFAQGEPVTCIQADAK